MTTAGACIKAYNFLRGDAREPSMRKQVEPGKIGERSKATEVVEPSRSELRIVFLDPPISRCPAPCGYAGLLHQTFFRF
jgi:hypothetical protein